MANSNVTIRQENRTSGISVIAFDHTEPGDIDIDLFKSDQIVKQLNCIDESRYMVVDFSGVYRMHSQAFWALMDVAQRLLDRNGLMYVTNVPEKMKAYFEITIADDYVEVADSVEAAVQSASSRS